MPAIPPIATESPHYGDGRKGPNKRHVRPVGAEVYNEAASNRDYGFGARRVVALALLTFIALSG